MAHVQLQLRQGSAGFEGVGGKGVLLALARGAVPPRDDNEPLACCMPAARCFAHVDHVTPVLAQVQQVVQQLKVRHGTE